MNQHAPAAELVARCFAARTSAHFAHLSTRSYAAHVALNEFYDEIIDAADEFIECYQGQFGLVAPFPAVPLLAGETQPIRALRDWAQAHRAECCRGKTTLENLIDGITGVCDRSLYKLVNLV